MFTILPLFNYLVRDSITIGFMELERVRGKVAPVHAP